ncbi:hypothetical protein DI272_16380 [Streptomyces sp. Act143]|uniref:hypothetical protein n=1 Tax=Streptomyces sp. Act143 TaxID=2200760 RepID=UPI000D67E7AF|nr:hypothetical protein [Streptomyces sp. Act143]PWI15573.1 hypothetical protein DI272_16380 [Streptomyces sp. Act143]
MTKSLALDDLSAPLRALRLLAADFGHLAAPSVEVSTIYPDQLKLTFYDDLSGFEAWPDALGIGPDDVAYHEQSGGRTRVLSASADHAGAGLELVGYGDVPAPAPVQSAT